MQCPCGDETINQVHQVKTMAKALEWTKGVPAALPIKIDQDKCPACGRLDFKVFDRHGVRVLPPTSQEFSLVGNFN
jgi:hypothetical protein